VAGGIRGQELESVSEVKSPLKWRENRLERARIEKKFASHCGLKHAYQKTSNSGNFLPFARAREGTLRFGYHSNNIIL
jgi:hypothetical protein